MLKYLYLTDLVEGDAGVVPVCVDPRPGELQLQPRLVLDPHPVPQPDSGLRLTRQFNFNFSSVKEVQIYVSGNLPIFINNPILFL